MIKDIGRLNLGIIYKEERKKTITQVDKFYKIFLKNDTLSCHKKELIEYWVHTEELLRKMFKYELSKRCESCKSCCCRDCKNSGGYFSSFDYFMYKLRGFEYPKYKSYLGKKGCTLKKDRRSFTCLFYICDDFPLLSVLKTMWEKIISNINQMVIEGKENTKFDVYDITSVIGKVLEEIDNKYNPLYKIDKKLLNDNTREHISKFNILKSSSILKKDIRKSIEYIIRLLNHNLRK